ATPPQRVPAHPVHPWHVGLAPLGAVNRPPEMTIMKAHATGVAGAPRWKVSGTVRPPSVSPLSAYRPLRMSAVVGVAPTPWATASNSLAAVQPVAVTTPSGSF